MIWVLIAGTGSEIAYHCDNDSVLLALGNIRRHTQCYTY